MKTDDLMPLSSDLQKLLLCERQAPEMPAALQAKIAARVADTISVEGPLAGDEPSTASGEPSGDIASNAPTQAAAQASPMAALAAKPVWLAVTAFGVGVATGVGGTVSLRSDSPIQPPQPAIVQSVDAGQSTMDAHPMPLLPDASLALAPLPVEVPTSSSKPATKTKRPEKKAPAQDKELAAERALLELSRTALTRGNASTALEHLQKHASLFRHGRLAEERDALWVQALALVGAIPQARSKAAKFRTRYPKSLFLPVIDQVVGGLP